MCRRLCGEEVRGGGDVVEEEREAWRSCAGNSKAGAALGHSFGRELDPPAPSIAAAHSRATHNAILVGVQVPGLDLRHVMQSIKSTQDDAPAARLLLVLSTLSRGNISSQQPSTALLTAHGSGLWSGCEDIHLPDRGAARKILLAPPATINVSATVFKSSGAYPTREALSFRTCL